MAGSADGRDHAARWRTPADPRHRLRSWPAAGRPDGADLGIGDRGPNLKISEAIGDYGLTVLEPLRGLPGAKVLPAPHIGPTLAELQLTGGARRTPSQPAAPDAERRPRVRPGSAREPYGRHGADLRCRWRRGFTPDPVGADTECVAVLADGSFWAGEEYGPSLIKIDAEGVVRRRWTPAGVMVPGGEALLPARAADRRMNRGFEGVAVSPDGRWLYAAFQSALDRPGAERTHAPIWKLDAETGVLAEKFEYPFDAPESFTADAATGHVGIKDLKICELAAVSDDRLLVLERISKSARIYRVELSRGTLLAKLLLFFH